MKKSMAPHVTQDNMGTAASLLSGKEIVAVSPDREAPSTAEVELAIETLIEAVPVGMEDDAPPLIAAAAVDDREEMRRLIESEDGLNAVNNSNGGGKTPVHWAVAVDAEPVLRSLLTLGRRGAGAGGTRLRLDAPDAIGFTALHYAALTTNSFAAQLLLDEGASVDWRDAGGQTALMKAAKWDDVALSRALLDAGADATAADVSGRTALHLAAAAGTVCTHLLLARGARPVAAAPDGQGRTPLTCALQGQRLAAAKALLPADDYTPRADDTGRTELHWAAASGTPYMVQRLLRFGPPRWPRDNDGMTPLMRALEARNEATAALLVKAPGRRQGCADAGGLTPLHWAARAGLPRLVRHLLLADVSPWTADREGRDALMWAVRSGDEETAMLVLRLAGFRQRADSAGRTALHLAAERGNHTVVLNLLQRGAHPDAADSRGRTPLIIALNSGATTVVEVLQVYANVGPPIHEVD